MGGDNDTNRNEGKDSRRKGGDSIVGWNTEGFGGGRKSHSLKSKTYSKEVGMKVASLKLKAGIVLVVLSCFVLALPMWAQSKSNVTGKVTDEASGEFLPGANVYLLDT